MILLRGREGVAEGVGAGSPGLGRDHSELNELVRGVLGIGVCTSSQTHVKSRSSSLFHVTGKDEGSIYSILTVHCSFVVGILRHFNISLWVAQSI